MLPTFPKCYQYIKNAAYIADSVERLELRIQNTEYRIQKTEDRRQKIEAATKASFVEDPLRKSLVLSS
jgi:phage shock protein A